MNETPDSLRTWAKRDASIIELDAHADAWEADRQAWGNDVVRLNEANAKIVRQAEVIAKLETSRIALQADNAALLELLNMAQNRALDWEKRFYRHVFNNGEMAGEEYFARESIIERRRVAIGRRNEDGNA